MVVVQNSVFILSRSHIYSLYSYSWFVNTLQNSFLQKALILVVLGRLVLDPDRVPLLLLDLHVEPYSPPS